MKKINILFFLLLPFIDVVTALTTRLTNIDLSIGVLVKSIYIVVLTIYIMFYSESKNKKIYLYYLGSILLFSLLYFITKPDLINKLYLFKEVSNLFKAFYASLLFFGLLVLFDDKKLDNNITNKIMFYSLITYTLLLIIPFITNTSFSSYGKNKNNEGTIGWFYSGNDVSSIILMLYPYIYFFLNKKINISNKKTYPYYLLLIPVLLSVFMIGTKTSWLGLVLITFFLMLVSIIKKENKKDILLLIIIFITSILLTFISPTASNVNKEVEKANSNNQTTVQVEKDTCNRRKLSEVVTNKTVYKIINSTLSGRQNKAYTEILLYNSASFTDKLFGIGFTDTNRINNCNTEKYIEIDLLDIFVHYGIIGLVIVIIPFIYVIRYLLINKEITTNIIKYLVITLFMILISFASGHVIGYPSSGIYLTIYLLLICIDKKKLKSNT